MNEALVGSHLPPEARQAEATVLVPRAARRSAATGGALRGSSPSVGWVASPRRPCRSREQLGDLPLAVRLTEAAAKLIPAVNEVAKNGASTTRDLRFERLACTRRH